MFERFTDPARRVIVLAQEESRLLGHHHIGPEHLLLGLMAEGEGKAAQALLSLSVSLGNLRARVAADQTSATSPEFLQFNQEAKNVLRFASRGASVLGHAYVDTEHLLLALTADGHASRVLTELGAQPGRVRERLLDLMSTWDLDNLTRDKLFKPAEGKSGGSEVLVPITYGLSPEGAGRVLAHAGLHARVMNARPVGHVYRTDPSPGSTVDPGSTVTVYLS